MDAQAISSSLKSEPCIAAPDRYPLDGAAGEVDALKRLQAETSAELDALLPSVLDKAFKGDL